MAGMYQAVANDGVRIPPRIVEATVGPDGVRTPTAAPEAVRVISPESARNRLKVAVSTLRKSGLEPILQTHAGGYLLDPAIPVRSI
jgi:cell division protein FtsI (penicillin-binding protein 3)